MEQKNHKKQKLDQKIAASLVEHGPAVKAATKILALGIEQEASDIFIEPSIDNVRIRYRIDGILYERLSFHRSFHSGLISRIKVMSGLDISEHRLPQDGRFKMQIRGNAVDFRVSVVPTTLGEKAVLRVLDKSRVVLDINKLGFDERSLSLFKDNLIKTFGMVLVCGPTGSGKTTTLYSALNFLNSVEKNIVSIEDPIEYELFGINQVAAQENIGLTFASALRSILRQDPDIVLVGEIRDFETADVAVKAALTGHLMLATLHTPSAPSAIIRLVDMGVEPFLISSSCLLIASQVLLRLLCMECRQETAVSEGLMSELKSINPDIGASQARGPGKVTRLYEAKGCQACNNTGYKGRSALIETLEVTPKIKELIVARAAETEVRKAACEQGMILLQKSAIDLVVRGLTTMEEAIRTTSI